MGIIVQSGLQSGQKFATDLSHKQQNALYRENQFGSSMTELQFRQSQGIDTSIASGSYEQPTLRRNSYSSANNTGEAKIVSKDSSGSSGGQKTVINKTVSLDQAASGYVAKTSGQPVTQEKQPVAYAQGEDHPLTTFTATKDEKAKLVQEYSQKLAGKWDSSTGSKNSNYMSFLESAKVATQEQKAKSQAFVQSGGLRDAEGNTINQITDKWNNPTRSVGATGQEVKVITPIAVNGKQTQYSRGGNQTASDASQAQFVTDTARQSLLTTDTQKQKEILSARQSLQQSGQTSMGPLESKVASAFYNVGGFIAGISKPGTGGKRVGEGLQNLSKGDLTDNIARGALWYEEAAGKADDMTAASIKPVFNKIESTKDSVVSKLNNVEIGINTKGQIEIAKKGNTKSSSAVFNAKTVVEEVPDTNAGTKALYNVGSGLYTEVKENPLKLTAEVGAFYAETAILGAAIEGIGLTGRVGLGRTSEFLANAASKSTRESELMMGTANIFELPAASTVETNLISNGFKGASKLFEVGSKSVEPGVQGYFAASVGSNLYGKAKSGQWEDVIKTSGELALGIPGYKKGTKFIETSSFGKNSNEFLLEFPTYKASSVLPKITEARISKLEGQGPKSTTSDVIFGKTLTIGDKPIISKYSDDSLFSLSSYHKGVISAPKEKVFATEEVTNTKTGEVTQKPIALQSFSKFENPFFEKTVQDTAVTSLENPYLETGLKIASAISKTKSPLYTPKTFEITSSAIPETAKPAIKKAILDYEGEIKVAGSVPMKAQADPFVTRTPHDLEIYGDSVPNILKSIQTELTNSGLKLGEDFKIKEHQIEFPSTEGKPWDTGIEIFDHTPFEGSEQIYSKSSIAFGFGERRPVVIKEEGKAIKTLNLAEQATRKWAGSSSYQAGELVPVHPGRVKDVGDFVDVSTAFAVKGNVKIEKDIVDFVELANKKFGGNEKYSKFKDVQEDPVFKYILENKKLPSKTELTAIEESATLGVKKDLFDVSDKSILLDKPSKSEEIFRSESTSKKFESMQKGSEYFGSVDFGKSTSSYGLSSWGGGKAYAGSPKETSLDVKGSKMGSDIFSASTRGSQKSSDYVKSLVTPSVSLEGSQKSSDYTKSPSVKFQSSVSVSTGLSTFGSSVIPSAGSSKSGSSSVSTSINSINSVFSSTPSGKSSISPSPSIGSIGSIKPPSDSSSIITKIDYPNILDPEGDSSSSSRRFFRLESFGRKKKGYKNNFGSFEQYNRATVKVESKDLFGKTKQRTRTQKQSKNLLQKIKW